MTEMEFSNERISYFRLSFANSKLGASTYGRDSLYRATVYDKNSAMGKLTKKAKVD
jgi:hypothetical protein